MFTDYANDDFEGYVVISQTRGEPLTGSFCRSIESRYDLEGHVLMDPGNIMQSNLGVPINDVDIVMARGSIVTFNDQFAGEQRARGAIESLLAQD